MANSPSRLTGTSRSALRLPTDSWRRRFSPYKFVDVNSNTAYAASTLDEDGSRSIGASWSPVTDDTIADTTLGRCGEILPETLFRHMGRIPLDTDIFLEAEHSPSLRTASKSIHSELTCAVLIPAINVCIIEDMAIVRAGLRMLIEGEEGMRVVGDASNRQQALAAAKTQTPDIFLLDLDLAREDALDLLAELKSLFTQARVVVLTQSSNCDLHQLAV